MRRRPFQTVKLQRDLSIPLAESILSSINTAVSKKLLNHLLMKEYGEVISATIDPKEYENSWDFARDYLAVELMSKFPNFDVGIDRQKVAFEKFLASETRCAETNRRLLSRTEFQPFWAPAVIHTAARKIEQLLGPLNWDEACLGFAFGPGSTTRVRRKTSDAYYKLSGIPECTYNCLVPATAALKHFKAWGDFVASQTTSEQLFAVAPGNKVVTVPKNAKTDRVIAIEPCMNIYLQKGLGSVIRRRLKRVGVNLDDQSHNQNLACEGSRDGSLATIDLASASDTISIEVVRALVPPDWMEAFTYLRSEKGVLPDGTVITYQKVSSMGNGFTFELESLIFWAICSAVRSLLRVPDRRMAIYGDDIIVPAVMAQTLIDVLDFFGFETNKKKTYIDGPFRESCGKHYFLGDDVSPFYMRKPVDTVLRLFWGANSIKRWSRLSWGLDSLLRQSWSFCYDQVPSRCRVGIPEGCGDGGFVLEFDEFTPRTRWNVHLSRREYAVRHFVMEDRTSTSDLYPYLLKALYRLEQRKGEIRLGNASARSYQEIREGGFGTSPPRYVLKRTWVPQWPGFGPWLD